MAWPRFRNPIQKLIVPTADLGLQELDFSALEFPGDVPMRLALQAGQSASGPRIVQLAANGQMYYRQKQATILHPSAAETATWISPFLDVSQYTNLFIICQVSAVSGTTPTLALQLRASPDNGVSTITVAGTANLTTAGAIGVVAAGVGVGTTYPTAITSGVGWPAPFGSTIQVRAFIGGTTPSFTFIVTMYAE